MLKIACVCAAFILTVAAFSTSAEAQRGPGVRGGFGGVGSMGAIGRMGGFSGARMGGIAGPGRIGAYGGRGV